ncbi:aldo/keto reductase [Levilactobacillus yiduensis]|uniref:aldo/keto reductase n=1 Tax=Levilactobacillus yiduensis TaxID=2953880 RepID=UPI000EF34E82|nr:aldo/keto reductase [Levilactobacillus yiduensis]AYM02265.1 aldo/keto reductase [Levilactobacillus brevis]
MEYTTLNNGIQMPKLGLGVFRVTDLAEAEEAVYQAIQLGYRLIDTAAAYGNEQAVGRAIKRSGVDRADLFITSKLWLTENSYEGAQVGLQRSLDHLGLDYLDLYLIHQPVSDYYGAWRYLSEAYRQGKIRAIGVDNFTQQKLVDLINFTDVRPAVNMIEANVFNQREADRQAMVDYDVQMEAWSPFSAGSDNVFELPVLKQIAAAHEKSTAQIILRWLMQRDIVAIPKTVHVDRLRENLAIFDFTLSDAEMQQISALNTGNGFNLPEDAQGFQAMLDMSKQFSVD